jgi:AcrR family transcriptional regulator
LRKGDATRASILREAGRQASVRGLSAVSLNDVAEGVGLSKSGLFKHFDSKEAMQEAMLADTCDRFVAFVWTPVEASPPGRARLEKIFDAWMDWGEVENAAGGCLIMSASLELDDQPGPLRDLLHGRLQRWSKALVREMKAMRDPPLDDDEARAAVFQMKSFVLGHTESGRFMGESYARQAARSAFTALLNRTGEAST